MRIKKMFAGILTGAMIFVGSIGGFLSTASASQNLAFSVYAERTSFEAGDEVTIVVALDHYDSGCPDTIGSMSLEIPKSTSQYTYIDGSRAVLVSGGEFSTYSDSVFFVYDPIAETASDIHTLPKGTERLFAFRIKIKSGVTTSDSIVIPIHNVIIGDGNDAFIGDFSYSDGKYNHSENCALKLATYEPGDINADTQINAVDALQALRHSVSEITLTGDAFTRGDVYKDNKVDATDALQILRYSVKEITKF